MSREQQIRALNVHVSLRRRPECFCNPREGHMASECLTDVETILRALANECAIGQRDGRSKSFEEDAAVSGPSYAWWERALAGVGIFVLACIVVLMACALVVVVRATMMEVGL